MTPDELLKLMDQLLSLDAYDAEQLLKQNNLNYGFDALIDVCMEDTLCCISSNLSKYLRHINKAFVYCIYDDGLFEQLGMTQYEKNYRKVVEVKIIAYTRPCNVYVKTIFDKKYRIEQEFSLGGRMFIEIFV